MTMHKVKKYAFEVVVRYETNESDGTSIQYDISKALGGMDWDKDKLFVSKPKPVVPRTEELNSDEWYEV